MSKLSNPSDQQITTFLATQARLPFTYPEVGWTAQVAPAGYAVDHNRVCLGVGRQRFEQAKAALQRWQMFDLGWVQLCWPHAPIQAGVTVGVLVNVLGVWLPNACRIVYTIDDVAEEAGVTIERFGFAYGTLPSHFERGEERFLVEWRHTQGQSKEHSDDSVWYDILAFSRPNRWLARIGYPVARQFQKRFARDSKQAMVRLS